MASTLKASNVGLDIVDKARRKKDWIKTEKAWADLATTSKATLRRFWASVPIQSHTFKDICTAVGIADWESIVDDEDLESSNAQISSKRLSFAIAGSIEKMDKHKLDAMVALIRKLGGDASIEILDIDEGSIKLILGGSSEALQRVEALFSSGQLEKIADIAVQDVHVLSPNEIAQLIKKNGGDALNLYGVNLREVDLHGADLRGANLHGANLHGADLRGADLREANLMRVYLNEADLMRAYLMRADLTRSYLVRTDLFMANLREANLREANLHEANLSGANLRGGDLREADLSGGDLREADLLGNNLGGANLREANLSGANLRGGDLREANLHGANLCGSDLREADLREADLREADLREADLREADLREVDLGGADLREAVVAQARFGTGIGLSEQSKENLIKRGAIFNDLLGETALSLVPSRQ